MHVAIIGVGYVGLVSGACFADLGHSVRCVDRDAGRIAALRAGRMPIYEPHLEALVARNVAAGRLGFGTDLAEAVRDAEVIFIAVGTPARRGDGHADLAHVFACAHEIAGALTGYAVIVTKSTVPVGTGDRVEHILRSLRPQAPFAVVSNPEFLREGAAIADFKTPDRIVIGTADERARAVMHNLYRPLEPGTRILFTGRRSAELVKYAANAFLALKIGFINEMADLCEQADADIHDVAHGIGLDRRIGARFLQAGPGFGGSCFPKDIQALIKSAQDLGAPARIVETVAAANEQRKRRMARRLIQACGGSVRGLTIGVLGLTFKPNTDDMRESPALTIITALLDEGAEVRAFDPEGMAQARALMPEITYVASAEAVAEGAHALALITEWDAFRDLDLPRLRGRMAGDVLVDYRNLIAPEAAAEAGFHHIGIGCRPARPAAPAQIARVRGSRRGARIDSELAASPA
ncbi:UDP-glucose dehydrogenase family protein [Methylobacterium radiodurans]|uniref:UDP-glucose 6-dehydrogenase n=1 Tax=Methylobacterium radiodurans TaxID=2202828 RepID=A0A2U8W1B9_9HYPH|nr:UDP-glucose/GDP-mannose dehydrogenase family protein [Methylobacterium radiodurans]AWN39242.1 UDP-glucose 6-dehydrogenase [Methylobacterium radiodurans]